MWCEHEDGVGGRAFDESLADLIVDKATKQFKGEKNDLKQANRNICIVGIQKEPTLLKKILREAERIKIILSTNKAASVFIENFQGDKTLQLSITREEFQG
jgi:molecular chaperone DnaK (HSP70)